MTWLRLKKIFVGICLFLSLSANVLSAPFPFPNLYDAGRVERNLRASEVIQPTTTAPPLTDKLTPKAQTVPQGDKIRFTLSKVTISGNTVFCTAELQKIFASSLNKNISLADLEKLVQDVSAKYRDAGYVLSRAFLPAQQIQNGAVRVQIIEGYVSKFEVSGDPWLAKRLLEQHGQIVMCSKPLKVSVLEREVLLANDIPGLSVQAVLTPSKNIPGSADLTFIAARRVATGYVTYDNFGTRYLGPLENSLGANINGILPGDTNAFHLAAATQTDEMYFYEYVHTQVLNASGLNYTIGLNYTQTKPGFVLDIFHIVGRSFSFYGNIIYPIIRSRIKNLFFRLAANYQNVSSLLLGTPNYNDLLRSISMGGYFNITDKLQGADSIELTATQGLPIFGAVMHVNQSRPEGRVRFTKINLGALRTQPFLERFSVLTAIQGQYSFNPLLATEQYSYGGPLFGRGYDPSEIIGDRGLAGKVEVHMLTRPEFKILQTIDFYIFYDAGEIWNLDKQNQPPRLSATSTGVGANFTFVPQLTGQFFIAKPLTRKVSVLTLMDKNPFQFRTFFQIVATF